MPGTPFSFTWVPVMGILFPILLLAVIFGFVAVMRYLRYREHLLMAQRGVPPETLPRRMGRSDYRMNPYRQLRSGITTSLVGLAILVGLWTMGTGPWLLGGLIPLAVGIGELLTFVITSPTKSDDNNSDMDNPGGPDIQ